MLPLPNTHSQCLQLLFMLNWLSGEPVKGSNKSLACRKSFCKVLTFSKFLLHNLTLILLETFTVFIFLIPLSTILKYFQI